MALTETFVELFQVESALGANVFAGGPSTISGDYSIFVKLCVPSDHQRLDQVKTVQLLTHGATLDHNYWDIAPGYSYVDEASEAGYATVSYDQLGVGKSDHPDPIQVVQATAQVAVIHELVRLLRSAKLGGYRFDKVVGVGHSAGSTLTQGITTQYPKDFDAVILSGTSTSASSVPLTVAAFNFINANADPAPQFKHLPPGFLTQQSAAGIQFAFYRYPNFDEEVFRKQVAHKQTNTLGVLFTLGSIVAPSTEFTGPVDIVNGENDLVFCGGNCLYPTDQNIATLSIFYPVASSGSQTFMAAGAGHAIAAHKSGPDSFKHMIQFLKINSL
jgi:pimeloyl-ACP methyl ester carboxylesterase